MNKHAASRARWSMALPLLLAACSDPRWPNVPFAEVRAYMFNLDEGIGHDGKLHHSIIVDGKLDTTVYDSDGVKLDEAQTERLLKAIDSAPKSEYASACFNPRHAFVFYDGQHRPVAWISICFECHQAQAVPALPRELDVCYVHDLFWSLSLPVLDAPEQYRQVLAQMTHESGASDH